MTLTRWRRLATGIAAGALVLCAAILGAQFRYDSDNVSVASDLRPTDAIAIPEDTDEVDGIEEAAADEDADIGTSDDGDDSDDAVRVIEVEDLPDDAAEESAAGDAEDAGDTEDSEDTVDAATGDGDAASTDAAAEDSADDSSTDDGAADDSTTDDGAADDSTTDDGAADDSTTDDPAAGNDANSGADTTEGASDSSAAEVAEPAPAPAATPPPPAPSTGEALGTGGGVDDAECGLDRLVIYAGAPVGGVAGRLRAALTQNGFGAGCARPVTVLASNCPQQFSGVLRGSGYDPSRPYVAASPNVDRNAMISIVGATGYTGSTIDILDFGFVNPDKPGEQWIAIFVPPSFAGWEGLASQAGLAPSSASLCGPSGELGR